MDRKLLARTLALAGVAVCVVALAGWVAGPTPLWLLLAILVAVTAWLFVSRPEPLSTSDLWASCAAASATYVVLLAADIGSPSRAALWVGVVSMVLCTSTIFTDRSAKGRRQAVGLFGFAVVAVAVGVFLPDSTTSGHIGRELGSAFVGVLVAVALVAVGGSITRARPLH